MDRPQHFYNAIQRSSQGFYIEKQSDELYLIISERSNNIYQVEVKEGKLVSCSCPHSFHRATVCKHITRVSMDFGLRIELELVKPYEIVE